MAKKKRRPRNRPPAGRSSSAQAGPKAAARDTSSGGGASEVRRAHKEEARRAREAARRRKARTSILRRVGTISAISLVAVGTLWFLQRAASPRPIPEEAVAAAEAASCSDVTKPAESPTREHLSSGQSYTYPLQPPTSGPHDPSPLPTSPEVYTTPVEETQAVHFLEHAGVVIYYRADGADALPTEVVDALANVAREKQNTLLAPNPSLPDGTSLAMTAWNRLQTCPATVTAAQASTIAGGFSDAFTCTSVAPEPKNSPDC